MAELANEGDQLPKGESEPPELALLDTDELREPRGEDRLVDPTGILKYPEEEEEEEEELRVEYGVRGRGE